MENKVYTAGVGRKVFNIIGLVFNTVHFLFALFYFSIAACALIFGGTFMVAFGEEIDGILIGMLWTTIYLVPTLVLMLMSIGGLVKCYKYGYKKTFEMFTYILSALLCLIDIVLAIVFVEFLIEFAILSVLFSFISFVIFIVAAIICILDKRK